MAKKCTRCSYYNVSDNAPPFCVFLSTSLSKPQIEVGCKFFMLGEFETTDFSDVVAAMTKVMLSIQEFMSVISKFNHKPDTKEN